MIRGQKKRAQLDEKTEVFCGRARDAQVLWDEVATYFRPGEELPEGAIIFDVGANIGLFSLRCQQKWGARARIFSFEPIPATFEFLEANAQRHGGANWQVFNAAMGQSAGTATFTHFVNVSGLSSLYPELVEKTTRESLARVFADPKLTPRAGWYRRSTPLVRRAFLWGFGHMLLEKKSVSAPVWTVSGAMKQLGLERIDWLKIDVEGAELDVLRGIEKEDWPKIERVVLEADNEEFAREIEALLTEMGFSQIEVEENPALSGFGLRLVFARR